MRTPETAWIDTNGRPHYNEPRDPCRYKSRSDTIANMIIAPRARYMIVCDEVLPDPHRPGKLMIVGLTSLIAWPAGTTSPVNLEKLVVPLILSDGHGAALGRLVCFNEESGAPIFSSPPNSVSYEGKDPSGHYAVVFKLHDCRFPAPGVYVLQFLFGDVVVQEQAVTVR